MQTPYRDHERHCVAIHGLTCLRRWPWVTILIAVTTVLIHVAGWSKPLELDRRVVAGEPWRLFTGHLTHFSGNHLAWDVVLWLAFGVWAERLARPKFMTCVLCATAAISAAVLALQPQFLVYRGLSGLDSAAFAFVLGRLFILGRRTHEPRLAVISGLALVGFLTKCGYEAAFDANVFVSNGNFEPVPLAHLAGALCGMIYAWPERTNGPRGVTVPARGRSGTEVGNV